MNKQAFYILVLCATFTSSFCMKRSKNIIQRSSLFFTKKYGKSITTLLSKRWQSNESATKENQDTLQALEKLNSERIELSNKATKSAICRNICACWSPFLFLILPETLNSPVAWSFPISILAAIGCHTVKELAQDNIGKIDHTMTYLFSRKNS